MKKQIIVLVLMTIGYVLGAQAAQPAKAQAPAEMKEGVLADSKGMTLYTFDKDTAGKIACTGECLQKWPIFATKADAAQGDFTVIKRDDGIMQWAFKGKPLYYFAGDKKAGEKNGDNVKEVWHVVK